MNIRQYLNVHKMTQADFASLIKVTPAYVSMLLRKENPYWPGREVMQNIVDVTNGEVTADDLLWLEGE